jgi:aryl-alcohol dehydrogenase-like predicted oxidoreductase
MLKSTQRSRVKGAFPALSKMRDEGIIRAWGIGVNTPLPILKVMEDADGWLRQAGHHSDLLEIGAPRANGLFVEAEFGRPRLALQSIRTSQDRAASPR